MKMIYKSLEDTLSWREEEVPVIIIENMRFKNIFINDLFLQSKTNNDAPFYISNEASKNDKLNFETIINPFELNVNHTTILNRVRKIYEGLIQEDYFELSELTKDISNYLNNLALSLPVNIEWEGDLNVKRLIQLFELTILDDSTILLEKIINYLQVNSQLGINKLFIFLNLKQYLSVEELNELYIFIQYEEIHIILIESQDNKNTSNKMEKQFIIDGDLCVLY